MKKTTLFLQLYGKKQKIEARECNSLFSHIRGKMFTFSREPILLVFDSEAMTAIHMFFVFQRLLVVWLDENQTPVAVKEMKPFISYHQAPARYVLEIPVGNKYGANRQSLIANGKSEDERRETRDEGRETRDER